MINNSSGMYRFTVGSFGSRARHHLGQIQCYCLPICNRILVIFVVEAGSTVVPITKSSFGVLGLSNITRKNQIIAVLRAAR